MISVNVAYDSEMLHNVPSQCSSNVMLAPNYFNGRVLSSETDNETESSINVGRISRRLFKSNYRNIPARLLQIGGIHSLCLL